MYVSDLLQIIAENTARYSGGKHIETRLVDILYPPKKETRTKEQIIDLIKGKLDSL